MKQWYALYVFLYSNENTLKKLVTQSFDIPFAVSLKKLFSKIVKFSLI